MTDEAGDRITVRETYACGAMPQYEGKVFAPEGERLAGWDRALEAVCGDTVYEARYARVRLLGDVNGDGAVNTRDLAMLRQYTVGILALDADALEAGNVYRDFAADGGALVNTRDVALLQQYIVGCIASLN